MNFHNMIGSARQNQWAEYAEYRLNELEWDGEIADQDAACSRRDFHSRDAGNFPEGEGVPLPTGGDLFIEHAKGQRLPPDLIAALAEKGISLHALETAWNGERRTVRLDQIVICPVRRFEFARDSQFENESVPALTLLAYAEDGTVVDIVAILRKEDAARAGYTLLTLGGRVSMLGQEQALRPRLGRGLRVYRTVWGWLRAERRGIVIIDPVKARELLRDCGPLIAEHAVHRRQLLKELTIPAPTILVAGQGE